MLAVVLIAGCDAAGDEGAATPPPPEEPTSDLTPPSDATEPIPRWLREHAIRFDTAEPIDDFSNLQPLKDIVGEARIVSLGEATHGTSEFFKMKHRLLKFLVEEMGFTAFAIEATMPEAFFINHYMHTGEGDPASLLSGLYSIGFLSNLSQR